jgi:hypothetical protein
MLYVCKLLWRPSNGWHPTARPSLFWRSRGPKQRTWSWQKSRPAFPEENRLGAIMIGQGVPEVKSHLPSALTGGLAGNDARRCITQNRNVREYGRDRDDLRNVIEDRRHFQDRTLSPPRRQLVRGVTPTGRSGFRVLAGPLRDVQWPAKFKAGHIDQYDGTSNPEEFIQIYQTVIEATGGDDRVKANFLHTTLTRAARS